MAAEPVLQHMLRAAMNARRLHTPKLTLSEALYCAPKFRLSERLICAAPPAVCSEPAADRILCYDYSFQTTQESVRVRAYFAQRTQAGQNQGNYRARRRLLDAAQQHREGGAVLDSF